MKGLELLCGVIHLSDYVKFMNEITLSSVCYGHCEILKRPAEISRYTSISHVSYDIILMFLCRSNPRKIL